MNSRRKRATNLNNYDVIVVGAGPAGSTAARACSMNGLKTLLLEKEAIPRDKRCAGGISNGALKELGFKLPEELVERRCSGMLAIQGRIKNEVHEGHTVATMVTRSGFDAFLSDKAKSAGVEIQANENCLSVKRKDSGVEVTTSGRQYLSNIVIGADGVHSRVAKTFRPPFTHDELRYCLTADIPLPESGINEILPDKVVFHYGYIDLGYAWLFPKKDYISAGIGGAFTQSKNLKRKFIEFLKLHELDLNVKPKGCLIPITNFKNDVYTDRIMLAGDAAGFVDCFSGEGIRFAIASGRIAAETAVKAHRENNYSRDVLKSYQDRFYSGFKDDLKCSTFMSRISFRYPNMLLGTFIMRDEVISNYYKVMSAEMSFRKYFKWLVLKTPGYLLKRIFGK